MAFGDLDGLPLKKIEGDLCRNIVSLRQSQDLFDDLSDDPEDWDTAIDLEMTCKPSQAASPQPIIHRPFEESDFFEAIQFPFDNLNASRFSRGHFGVWYGSELLGTTVHETAHHWVNGLLRDAGYQNVPGVKAERRVHLVQCSGALVNLMRVSRQWPALRSDDYSACQSLGDSLHQQGLPGIWTPSARCDGSNAVILTPDVLSNPRHYCYLTYEINDGQVTVWRSGHSRLTLQELAGGGSL